MNPNITIRVAKLTDAPRLAAIYAPYVEKTAITFEYHVPSVEDFRGRMATTLKDYPYLVAEKDGQIAGYAYVGSFNGREAYRWAVETSIYIDTADRHAGIGGQLYQALENVCKLMGITNLNACIGYPKGDDEYLTTNSADFHHHIGYQLVGNFHDCGYKFNHWYDMIWMEKIIGKHPAAPAPVKNFNEIRPLLNAKLGIKP